MARDINAAIPALTWRLVSPDAITAVLVLANFEAPDGVLLVDGPRRPRVLATSAG